MIRRVALLVAIGTGLGLGATAIAQEGESDDLAIEMQRGCLKSSRVTIKITPPSGAILSPVHIRTDRGESVHLTGVTQQASVTVRIPRRGRVSVSGETTGGERFSMVRHYRACSPEPTSTPRARPRPSPPHTVSGGGEG